MKFRAGVLGLVLLAISLALVASGSTLAQAETRVRASTFSAAVGVSDFGPSAAFSQLGNGQSYDGHASVPVLAAEGGADLAPTVLSKGDQLALNKGLGDAWRDEVAMQMDQLPNRSADIEVTKSTPIGPRRLDLEVYDGAGNPLGGIETKFGGSPYTISQRFKDMWLWYSQGYRVNVLRYPG